MKRRLLVLTIAVAVTAPLAAQDAPRPSQPQPDRYTITIEGCVRGGRFIPISRGASREVSAILSVAEYRLRGPRSVLRTLRDEHDGHEEEITGIVEIPRDPRLRAGIFTKEVGEGRLLIGGRQNRQALPVDERARPATLTVESSRHRADRCADR